MIPDKLDWDISSLIDSNNDNQEVKFAKEASLQPTLNVFVLDDFYKISALNL